jgi:hypothetical protein
MADGVFVTAINCMDGRVQEPVIAWMKRRFSADFVDMITEPGPDRILTDGLPECIESVRRRVVVSVDGHGSRVVAMVVHHDCAGFPVSKETHLTALQDCIRIIASWDLPVRIVGLWVGRNWQVELVNDTHAR